MTHTLSKATLDALKVELAKYGLDVKKLTKARKFTCELEARIAHVQSMQFKTAGVKASILKALKLAKASRDWKAANPGTITELLAMFGARLQDVRPWSGTRWECLRNALPAMARRVPLAITHQEKPPFFGPHCHIFADAAAPVKLIVCE